MAIFQDLNTQRNDSAFQNPIFPTAAPAQPAPYVLFGKQNESASVISHPTPAEAAVLQSAGWNPGDRVPTTLASSANPAAEMAKFKQEEAARQSNSYSVPDQPAPGVIESLQQLRSGNLPKIELEDDVTTPKARIADVPEEADDDPTGLVTTMTHCPRCNWELGLPDLVEITEEDKLAYVVALLGCKPFLKTYKLFGQLEVSVRALTLEEVDACFQQATLQYARHELKSPAEYVETVMRYRVCMQTARVHGGTMSYRFPLSLPEWNIQLTDEERKTMTPVAKIYEHFTSTLLSSESVYRLLQSAVQNFNRLVTKIEAQATDPDFTVAIRQ